MIDRRALLGAGLFLPAAASAQSWRVGRAPGFRSGLRFLSQAVATTTTWNPADKGASITLSGGNLTATAASTVDTVTRSVAGKSSGKFIYEATTSGSIVGIGFAAASTPNNIEVGGDAASIAYYPSGNVIMNNAVVATYASWTPGTDRISAAVNATTKTVWFAKNGVFVGDPAAGSGGFVLPSAPIYAAVDPYSSGSSVTANFGATAFAYPVPNGYGAFTTGTT